MHKTKKSSVYNFYLKFNLISTWLVVALPFILLAILLIFDIKPDICDSVNNFLLFFTIFALIIVNIKQSSNIIDKKSDDEES